jgi:lethal(2) giant larvae protein
VSGEKCFSHALNGKFDIFFSIIRVRRVSFATFSCKTPIETIQPGGKHSKTTTPAIGDTANDTVVADPNIAVHTETALLCLTNLGDCLVLSVPELKRQLNAAAIRREDIK